MTVAEITVGAGYGHLLGEGLDAHQLNLMPSGSFGMTCESSLFADGMRKASDLKAVGVIKIITLIF